MKKTFFTILAFSGFMVMAGLSVLNSGGKTNSTGSPGEGKCGDCHSGGGGQTAVTISSNIPSNQYVPGQTYNITVTVSNSNFSNFGFAAEVLHASTNDNSGTIANPGTGVQVQNSMGGRKTATHTSPKSGTGTADFTFEWTAPSTPDTVKIYAIGNAVNLNGGTSGDSPAQSATVIALTPQIPSSTNTAQNQTKLQVFPNPTTDLLHIQLPFTNQYATIQLLDLQGKSIATLFNQALESNQNVLTLSIPDHLPNGNYILYISNAQSQAFSQKVIIQR